MVTLFFCQGGRVPTASSILRFVLRQAETDGSGWVEWVTVNDVKHQVLVSSNSFFKTAGQQ